MAIIDRLYLKEYLDFDELRTWIIIHKPSLLYNMYSPFDTTYSKWMDDKEKKYQKDKERVDNFFADHPDLEAYTNKNAVGVHWIEMWESHIKLESKEIYKDDIDFPVANFTCSEDRWLFWHCPLNSVRKYLIEQCGYKERWYHKILFKFTMYKD